MKLFSSHRRKSLAPLMLCSLAPGLVAGCRTPMESVAEIRPERPSYISHVMVMQLEDPSQRDALIADCETMLAPIPGVETFAAGRRLAVSQDIPTSQYDVGLYVGFLSRAHFMQYLEHSNREAFLAKWEPRLESVQAYEIADPTP